MRGEMQQIIDKILPTSSRTHNLLIFSCAHTEGNGSHLEASLAAILMVRELLRISQSRRGKAHCSRALSADTCTHTRCQPCCRSCSSQEAEILFLLLQSAWQTRHRHPSKFSYTSLKDYVFTFGQQASVCSPNTSLCNLALHRHMNIWLGILTQRLKTWLDLI